MLVHHNHQEIKCLKSIVVTLSSLSPFNYQDLSVITINQSKVISIHIEIVFRLGKDKKLTVSIINYKCVPV